MPLLLYCMYTLIGAIGNLYLLLIIDVMGRRPAFLTSFVGCRVCIVIEAAMIGRYGSPVASGMALFSLSLQLIQSIGVTEAFV
jgi:hypothetical protein